MTANLPVILWGAPGTGKTSSVTALWPTAPRPRLRNGTWPARTPGPKRWTERLRPGRSRRGFGRTLDEQEAARMRAMLRAGIPADKARPFIDLGWHRTEAVAWAERSLDAGEAKLFHAFGFSPAEAQRVAAQGTDAISVMTDWWRAGVPIDEVAA